MIPVKCDFPPGTIVLATSGPPRYAEFWGSEQALRVPSGTMFNWNRTYDAASGRESMVRNRNPKGAWVWFLDDDHTFDPEQLLRLLNRGLPVVSPIASRRRPPFKPIVMRESSEPYTWAELHGTGLMTLEPYSVVGMGGLLVWESVLKKLTPPYFRVGQYNPGHMQEDVYFCRSLWDAGFPIVIDRDEIIGHIDSCTILPKRVSDGWEIECIPGYGERAVREDQAFTEPPMLFHPLPAEVTP